MKRAALAVVFLGCGGGGGDPAPAPPPPHREPRPLVIAAEPEPPLHCFDEPRKFAIDGGTVSDLALGDFDGDGVIDVVAIHDGTDFSSHDYATLLHGDGQGALQPRAPWSLDDGTFLVQSADFDGDGKLDLVTSSVIFDGTGTSSIHVYLGHGDGTFASAGTRALTHDATSSAAGDVTGDGRPEILVIAPRSVDIYAAPKPAARLAQVAGGRYPQSVIVRDLDGDGRADLAFVNHNDEDLMIARQRPDGTFARATSIATCPMPNGLRILDWNGDGKLDAVVSCFGNDRGARVGVVSDVAGKHPKFVALSDERVQDFEVANGVVFGLEETSSGDTTIRVIDARGNLVGTTDAGGQVRNALAADLDRDGKLDIVTSMWTGRPPGYVLVWHGRACTPRTI